MAYVPGLQHDVFLSYAHADDPTWVQALEVELRRRVRERLGLDVSFWQDEQKLRGGQNWVKAIEEALVATAALVAVISPSYRSSEWCANERKTFLDQFPDIRAAEVGLYNRFLKVVKTPWEDNGHLQFFPELQHVAFHDETPRTSLEYTPGTDAFRRAVIELAESVAAVLRSMRRQRERVYVAAAPDRVKDRDALREELLRRGYDVQPEGPRDGAYTDAFLSKEMEKAVLSVHLLGPGDDAFSTRLAGLGADLGLRMLFSVPKEGAAPSAAQKALFDALGEGRLPGGKELPKGFVHFAGDGRAMIQEVVAALRPKPSVAQPSALDARSRLYVLCDPSSRKDVASAQKLRADILERESSLKVDLSDEPGSSQGDVRQVHLDRLRSCDGLLLLQEEAPAEWMLNHLSSFVYAERLLKRPPIKSKAILVEDAALLEGQVPEALIIKRRVGGFTVEDLGPFLAPLRRPDAAPHAGA